MVTELEQKYIAGAIENINDAIAGIREIKVALGMTENSHIEKDLRAAINRLELAIR